MGISTVSTGKYKVYHILGKKIGCTKNVKKRVEKEQGYKPGEYEILFETDDIKEAAKAERTLQQDLGYKVDIKPYDKLFNKNMKKVNVTEQTTTFAISKAALTISYAKTAAVHTGHAAAFAFQTYWAPRAPAIVLLLATL